MMGNSLKKSGIKAGIAALLCMLSLCSLPGQKVSARDTLQIGIDQYEVTENGEILVYVNQNGGGGFTPAMDGCSLLIGKNPVTVKEIRSFQEMGEPVTYLCLVDISGSMTKEGIEQTRSILRQLAEKKKDGDNVCITTMGNEMQSFGFLSKREELGAAIDSIERIGTEDTNLYYSLTEALNVLKTDSKVHKKRCLLIFSDGEDDQKKGITQKEAEDAVKESHIPVFTVTLPGSNLKDAEGSAKILGSFARNSAGGEHYAPQLGDGSEYNEICDRVNQRLQASLVVRAGLEEVKAVGDDTVYIKVELSDGANKASDGITVPAGTILKAIEEVQKGTEVKVTVTHEGTGEDTEGNTEPSGEETEGTNKPVLIGILLLALFALIALLLLLGRRAGRKTGYEEDDFGYGGDEQGYADSQHMGLYGSENTIAPGAHRAGNDSAKPEGKAARHKNKVKVTLFKVGPGDGESYELTVKNEAVIGRSKSCRLSFDNDSALSGRHCSIIYRDGEVFVRDENSTNGTFVNGVPIVGEYKVAQDDIVLIGSSEYRIVWE